MAQSERSKHINIGKVGGQPQQKKATVYPRAGNSLTSQVEPSANKYLTSDASETLEVNYLQIPMRRNYANFRLHFRSRYQIHFTLAWADYKRLRP